MVNEPELKSALLSLVEVLKSHTEKLFSLEIELAAVRESVRALDPTFDDALAQKREKIREKAFPSVAGLVGTLQLLTQKMTNELIN
jgi:hypothetical protein